MESNESRLEFSDKLVVITGVGRAGQIGEALALGFAERGAVVALLDRTGEAVQARADALVSAGFHATAHAADLSNVELAHAAAREVLAAHGPRFGGKVHGVVCAAGGFGSTGPVDDASPEGWRKQFTINLDTAFATTSAFLPALRAARGALVYFASPAALPGGNPGGLAAYAAAKSGVVSLMRSVARDEGKNGVRANAVAPTQVETTSNLESMGDDKRYVTRDSVADVVAFLCAQAARNISGQVITLA